MTQNDKRSQKPAQLDASSYGPSARNPQDLNDTVACGQYQETHSDQEGEWDEIPPPVEAVAAPTIRVCASRLPSDSEATVLSAWEEQTADPDTEAGFIQNLGPYRLLGPIGRGGMGHVYRAVHSALEREFAVKLLPAPATASKSAVERFQREMKAIGKLDHPNLVRATDAGEIDGTCFLTMELLDGVDTAALLRRHGPLPTAVACEIARQTACGLQYIHEQGLVHRDVKPSNVMLTRDGQVKLLDLGLALLGETAETELTTFGQLMGTVDYMAPEQAEDCHTVDPRADLYSLGATLYHLLTGEGPFPLSRHGSRIGQIIAHRQEPVPDIRQRCAEVPMELGSLVTQLLAKDPAQRPATAAEVAERLEPLCAGADLSSLLAASDGVDVTAARCAAPAASLPDRSAVRWDRRRPATLILVVLVCAAGLVVIVRNRDGEEVARVRVPEGGTAVLADEQRPKAERSEGALPSATASNLKDVLPFTEVRCFEGHTDDIDALAFSPDGQFIASGGGRNTKSRQKLYQGKDFSIRLWDVASGKLMQRFQGHQHRVMSLVFALDGKRLVSASHDSSVRVWNVDTGQQIHLLEGFYQYLDVSEDGRYVLAGGWNGVLLLDLDSFQLRHFERASEPGHLSGLSTVALSDDGRYVAAAGGAGGPDYVIRIWDRASGIRLRDLVGHSGGVGAVVFLPQDRQVLSAGSDRTIRIWDPSTGREIEQSQLPEGIPHVGFASLGDHMVTGGNNLVLLDRKSGKPLKFWGPAAYETAVSPEGRYLASAGPDKKIRVWRLPDGLLPAI